MIYMLTWGAYPAPGRTSPCPTYPQVRPHSSQVHAQIEGLSTPHMCHRRASPATCLLWSCKTLPLSPLTHRSPPVPTTGELHPQRAVVVQDLPGAGQPGPARRGATRQDPAGREGGRGWVHEASRRAGYDKENVWYQGKKVGVYIRTHQSFPNGLGIREFLAASAKGLGMVY